MDLSDIDPSLRAGEAPPATLHDGYAPPGLRGALLAMHPGTPPTHPVEPERHPPAPDDAEPNTTQLPVEPEFGQALPPAEPEDPTVKPPVI
jgi:hypothetical protein